MTADSSSMPASIAYSPGQIWYIQTVLTQPQYKYWTRKKPHNLLYYTARTVAITLSSQAMDAIIDIVCVNTLQKQWMRFG